MTELESRPRFADALEEVWRVGGAAKWLTVLSAVTCVVFGLGTLLGVPISWLPLANLLAGIWFALMLAGFLLAGAFWHHMDLKDHNGRD